MSVNSPTRRQVVEALAEKSVRAKAAQQIQNGPQVVPLNMDLPVRLFRSPAGTSNFEALNLTTAGDYYKPVAFFKPDGACLVLGEYWPAIVELNEERGLGFEVQALNKEANAVIAAFSAETLLIARTGNEIKYVANGMRMEMYINHDGNPQIWAGDRYGFDEAIAVYDFRANMINPTVAFKKMFDAMERRNLLSAFNFHSGTESHDKRISLDAAKGDIVSALHQVVESLEQGGQQPKLLAQFFYLTGRLKFLEGDYDASKDAFGQCNMVAMNYDLPVNHETHYWFGRINEKIGKTADAKMYYGFALEKYSGNPNLISKQEIELAIQALSAPAKATSLNDIRFESADHVRYQDGRNASGHNKGAKRGIEIKPNIRGGEGYTVTIYNQDGNHPLWGDNVQMAPKQMRIVKQDQDKVELRGFGHDPMGEPFSDYGVTVHFVGDVVEKIVLHMHDRNIDIEYLR